MIFSDNYTVVERYSLVSGERLADYSEMPYRYTPLYDTQYKPDMDVGVRNQVGVTFKYDPTIADVEALKDEEKIFGIYHNGSEPVAYRTKIRMRFSSWRAYRGDYIAQTHSSTDRDLYDELDKVVKPSRKGNAAFLGHDHDSDGYITGCTVTDRYFELSHYNNPLLEKLEWYAGNAPNYCRGILTVRRENEVSWMSRFAYPTRISEIPKNEFFSNRIREPLTRPRMKTVSFRQSLRKHLAGYVMYEILNLSQVDDIYALVPDTTRDAQVRIEHVFRGSELVDIIAHIPKYDTFDEVQVTRRWIQEFDEQGNEIYWNIANPIL